MRARARHKPGVMNKLEARYAELLEERKRKGEIVWYAFEGMKFVLTDRKPRTTYTPDFIVQLADGILEAHEVKGHWEPSARIKIKCAASKFPIEFIAVKPRTKKDGGGWKVEEF